LIWKSSNREINMFDYNENLKNKIKKILIKDLVRKKSQNYQDNDLSIYEPMDKNLFNFSKVNLDEIIIFKDGWKLYPESNITDDFKEKSIDTIITNIYPISNYHCLILPYHFDSYPQFILNPSILYRIFQFLQLFASNDLIIGYNSKGAKSSINSLHFQTLFLRNFNETIDDIFLLNDELSFKAFSKNDIEIYTNSRKFPLNYIRININHFTSFNDNNLVELSNKLFDIISILHDKKIPYNLVLTQKYFFIFPRKHQNIVENIHFAFVEFIGIIVFNDTESWKTYDNNMYNKDLLALDIGEEIIEILLEKIKIIFNK